MLALHDIYGLPELPTSNISCTSCFWRKQSRTKVPKQTTSRAFAPLKLIHLDLCGPFCTPSLGGAQYFLIFIDDYSRLFRISFMSRKDKAFDKSGSFIVKSKLNTSSLFLCCASTMAANLLLGCLKHTVLSMTSYNI